MSAILRKFILAIGAPLITAFLTGCASLNPVAGLEKKMIYMPSEEVKATPQDAGLPFEDVYLKTEDGVRLNGWFVRGGRAGTTLLYFHGNAGNISHRLEKLELFHKMGLNVFIIDYRGYGRSSGQPSEKGLYRDALTAYEYLLNHPDVDPDRIVAYGVSLGGAVAVEVAAKRPVAGLILESTFTSVKDMAAITAPKVPRFLIGTKMNSLQKIPVITAPKLILHSEEDRVVPYGMARDLFHAAPEPKSFIPLSGEHNGGWRASGDRFEKGIEAFLVFHRLI